MKQDLKPLIVVRIRKIGYRVENAACHSVNVVVYDERFDDEC